MDNETDSFWRNFYATKDLICLPAKRPELWRKLYSFFGGKVKKRVLFVCVHNSARSQMAEAWLNYLYGDSFYAQSAGLKPGSLNPLAVEVMQEVGIDISYKKTQGVFDLVKVDTFFDYVITVCDKASAEQCPTFSGECERIGWNFADPSAFVGSKEEKLQQTRVIRDSIKEKIESWCSTTKQGNVARAFQKKIN